MSTIRIRFARAATLGLIAMVLAVTAAGLPVAPAHAQQAEQETTQIYDAVQGPYRVVTTIEPAEPKLGVVHFVIDVTHADSGLPAEGLEMLLVAHDYEDTPTYQVRAISAPSNRSQYIGNITLEEPGNWTINAKITTADGAQIVYPMPLHVGELFVAPGAAGTWVLLLIIAGFLGVGSYLVISARRIQRRQPPTGRSPQTAANSVS